MGFFRGIDLFSIGADIINGLIRGIGSMATAVWDKAKSIATGIGKAIAGALQVESPSRVTTEIGEFVGEGLIKGMDSQNRNIQKSANRMAGAVKTANSIKSLAKSFADIGKETIDGFGAGVDSRKNKAVSEVKSVFDEVLKTTKAAHAAESETIKKNNAEIKKIEKRSNEDIYLIKQKALKDKRSLTESESIKIRRIEEDSAKKIRELKSKNNKEEEKLMAEQVKNLKLNNAELLKASEKYVDDKKKNGEMSLSDEVYFWNAMYRTAEVGTEQYEFAMGKHQSAVKQLRQEIESVNKEYNDRMLEIDKEYNTESQKLHDEWEKAYDSRMSQLLGFAGIFDEFKKKTEVSGQGLVTSLETQVGALGEYSEVINSLGDRIDDNRLVDELKSMGVKSLGELQALNSLSDKELQNYVNLYQEKFRLAKEQTDNEMQPMTEDIDKKLIQLKKDSSKRLDELNVEWRSKIQSIVNGTSKEFDSMRQVGIDAMQKLSSGMDSMSDTLKSQAQAIADSIRSTLQSAFEIKAPTQSIPVVASMTGFSVPDFSSKTSNVRSSSGSSGSQGGSSGITQNITINSPQPTSPADNARLIKQQSRQFAMEWGS